MPLPSRQFEHGQWATPVPVRANKSISCPSSFTQWACQDIGAGPTKFFSILSRATSKLRERIGDVLVVLGQMGVQHDPLVAGQQRRIAH